MDFFSLDIIYCFFKAMSTASTCTNKWLREEIQSIKKDKTPSNLSKMKKADLITILTQHDEKYEICKDKVSVLRAKLAEKNLSTEGKKEDLIKSLWANAYKQKANKKRNKNPKKKPNKNPKKKPNKPPKKKPQKKPQKEPQKRLLKQLQKKSQKKHKIEKKQKIKPRLTGNRGKSEKEYQGKNQSNMAPIQDIEIIDYNPIEYEDGTQDLRRRTWDTILANDGVVGKVAYILHALDQIGPMTPTALPWENAW